jgi:hypothetical protein
MSGSTRSESEVYVLASRRVSETPPRQPPEPALSEVEGTAALRVHGPTAKHQTAS